MSATVTTIQGAAPPAAVRYEVREGIGWITLNRPEVLNALTAEMLRELTSVLERAGADDAVRALIMTGAGNRAFSAGADIAFLAHAAAVEVRELARLAVAVTARIETLGKVVVAAINGDAIGGGLELAEACTLRVAAAHARLGHPEVGIGAVAGFGGTTRLPRLVGKGRAAELLLTGKILGAAEAERIGLVNRVVPAEVLVQESAGLVREILSRAPIAVSMTWDAMHRGLDLALEDALLLGAEYFGRVAYTEDFRTGTRAFLNKTRAFFAGQ